MYKILSGSRISKKLITKLKDAKEKVYFSFDQYDIYDGQFFEVTDVIYGVHRHNGGPNGKSFVISDAEGYFEEIDIGDGHFILSDNIEEAGWARDCLGTLLKVNDILYGVNDVEMHPMFYRVDKLRYGYANCIPFYDYKNEKIITDNDGANKPIWSSCINLLRITDTDILKKFAYEKLKNISNV